MAGIETIDRVELLARGLVHISDTVHVTTRYDGCCADRPRGIPFRRPQKAEPFAPNGKRRS